MYKVGGSTSQDNNSLGYNIAKAPIYFVRSGYVDIKNGLLDVRGYIGYNWSSRRYSTDIHAYYFRFFSSVESADYRARWDGLSLRWLGAIG